MNPLDFIRWYVNVQMRFHAHVPVAWGRLSMADRLSWLMFASYTVSIITLLEILLLA